MKKLSEYSRGKPPSWVGPTPFFLICPSPTFATEACRGMNSFIIQWVAHKGLYYI